MNTLQFYLFTFLHSISQSRFAPTK